MNVHPATIRLTYDDYLHFPEDLLRHELIDGEHSMTPAPGTWHQAVVVKLSWILESHLRESPRGRLFVAPCDVVLSEFDVVQPDLLFVAEERAEIVTEKNIRGAPDLVIEILSDSTRERDVSTKRELYERFGVKEYWLVDPAAEEVTIFRLEPRGFELAAQHGRGETVTTPLLPGLEVVLGEVFG